MRSIKYLKSDRGILIVSDSEEDLSAPLTVIGRFRAFFAGVPLHGGREWETLEVDQIVEFFREEAAPEIRIRHREIFDCALREYAKHHAIVRWWLAHRGYEIGEVPSLENIYKAMAERCLQLSTWARENQDQPFYAEADLSYLIEKSRKVAELLVSDS